MSAESTARDSDLAEIGAARFDAFISYSHAADGRLAPDLRFAHNEDRLSLHHVEFRDAILTLAAALHGKDKDEIDSSDIREHRHMMRLRSAVAALLALTLTATVLGVVAWQQRGRAIQTVLDGLPRQSASEVDRDPRLAAWLAVAAYTTDPGSASKAALMRALDATRHVHAFVQPPRTGSVPPQVAISGNGSLVAHTTTDGRAIVLYDVRNRRSTQLLRLPGIDPPQVISLVLSRDGSTVAASGPTRVTVWETATGRQLLEISMNSAEQGLGLFTELALSRDGHTLLATKIDGMGIWDTGSGKNVSVKGPGGILNPEIVGFTADESAALLMTTSGVWQLDVRTAVWTQLGSVKRGLSYAVAGPDIVTGILNEVSRWDPRTAGASSDVLLEKGRNVNMVRASPDGAVVLIVDDQGRVLTFGAGLDGRIELFKHGTSAVDADLDDSGRYVVSAGAGWLSRGPRLQFGSPAGGPPDEWCWFTESLPAGERAPCRGYRRCPG